ncbi:MAG: serine/threonine protein phosphatase [Dokdonella sp.]
MAQRLVIDDRTCWLKRYGTRSRRLSLGMLDRAARALDIPALRPPSHPGGERAKALEKRRLSQLRDAAVIVPEVVGEGDAMLVLADIGRSVSSRLSSYHDDHGKRDDLLASVVKAIADVHAKDGYLGQPTPRNIVTGSEGVGFIDFEEDPLEVMSLRQAQVRDWILFTHGAARHYAAQTCKLAKLVGEGLAIAEEQVAEDVAAAGAQLAKIETFVLPFGGRTGKLQLAIRALRSITVILLLTTGGLLIDYLPDEDIDLFAWNLIGLFV